MNPSCTKLISSDAVQDQSSTKELSQAIRKRTKGKKGFYCIGGMSLFANILEKSGTVPSTEKKGDGKEASIHARGKLTIGQNGVEKELTGNTAMNAGKKFVIKREQIMTGSESFAPEKEVPCDKTLKQPSAGTSSKIMTEEKEERKLFVDRSENIQSHIAEKVLEKKTQSGITNAFHGLRSDSARHESMIALGTLPLKNDIPGRSGMKKSVSGDSMPMENKTGPDLRSTSISGAKEQNPVKKHVPENTKLIRLRNESEDKRSVGDLDIAKGFEIKAAMVHKVSSDTKVHEVLLKSNAPKPEVMKETAISTNKIHQMDEKVQENKNLSTKGNPSEKPFERGFDDAAVARTDTSTWTAPAAGVKDGGNYGVWSNPDAEVANPVQFQDITGQIEDSAAQLLKKGTGRIVITLEPPNLGTLNLDVKVHNDMVRLILITDNHDVKQVLHSNLDQLKTALQDQGLNMDRFDVLVQQRSSDNPGFHQWGSALFEEGRGKRENSKEDNVPPQPLPVHSDAAYDPHMGMISLFA